MAKLDKKLKISSPAWSEEGAGNILMGHLGHIYEFHKGNIFYH